MPFTILKVSPFLIALCLMFNTWTVANAQLVSIEEIADQFDKSLIWPQEIGEMPIVYYFDSIQSIERRVDFLQTIASHLDEAMTAESSSQLALDIREFVKQELLILQSCQPGVWDFTDFHNIYNFFNNLQNRIKDTHLQVEDTSLIVQGLKNLGRILEAANSRLNASLTAEIYPPANSSIFWGSPTDDWLLEASSFQEFFYEYTTQLCSNCKNADYEDYLALYTELITPHLLRFSQLINELRLLSHNFVSAMPPKITEPCITKVMANVGMDSRTPLEILDLGLRELERTEREMYEIVARQTGNPTESAPQLKSIFINQFLQDLMTDPAQYSQSSDEYLKLAQKTQERALTFLPKISDYFIQSPKIVDLGIETETFPGAMYSPQDETVFLNRPTPAANYQLAQLMVHEGLPGHHLERSISMQKKGTTSFEQHFHGDGSIIEGWAFYMEEYMDEIGFYQNDLERLSYLEDIRVRALRLILPYRIFFDQWSLDQARSFSQAHSVMPDWRLNSEIQRNSHWRGQVLNYMIGKEDILNMKNLARQSLGSSYTDQAFHTFILSHGNIHPHTLKILFENWLNSQ